MAKSQSVLEKARHDAQELHKKINANITKAGHATWADVRAAQADTATLARQMKTLAADQSEAVRIKIKAAIVRMDDAGKLVEDKAVAIKDGVSRANAQLLDSAHKAAQSLSAALADVRSAVAHSRHTKDHVA